MKKFIDVEVSDFRPYTEDQHLSSQGALFTLTPFKFSTSWRRSTLTVEIPAGFIFTDVNLPFGAKTVAGVSSAHPQGAAIVAWVLDNNPVLLNKIPVKTSGDQIDTIVEAVFKELLHNKLAYQLSRGVLEYSRSLKNNRSSISYGQNALHQIKEHLKENKCQHA